MYYRNYDKINETQIGIYCIYNNKNNKRYIGQTIYLNRRWTQHKSKLKSHCHNNKLLQSDYDMYGIEVFEYIILEYCSLEELNNREKYWIKYYNSINMDKGYNQAVGGVGALGYKHTEEELNKMSEWQNPRPIVQLTIDGKYLNTFPNQFSICRYLNKDNIAGIRRCCEHKAHQAFGFIWVYKSEYDSGDYKREYHLHTYNRPVIQYDAEHNYIREYESAAQAERDNNIYPGSVSKVCKGGKRKFAGGYMWEFKKVPA